MGVGARFTKATWPQDSFWTVEKMKPGAVRSLSRFSHAKTLIYASLFLHGDWRSLSGHWWKVCLNAPRGTVLLSPDVLRIMDCLRHRTGSMGRRGGCSHGRVRPRPSDHSLPAERRSEIVSHTATRDDPLSALVVVQGSNKNPGK